MSSDWPMRKISDVAEFLNHKRVPLKSLDRQKRQGQYPYYGASGIIDYIDDYIFDGTYLLVSEDGENLRSRKTPIAFKTSGKFWVNNHAHILEEKEEGTLDYLEYYFSKLDLTPYITGAVQPKLNKANLDSIIIPFPEKDERLAINEVLNSLTYKIQLNRPINQTLEQIAQAIFKSWFVDFEPVKAKIAAKENGQDPERAAMCVISSKSDAELNHLPADQLSQLATTAALFPDELVESELGMIPRGWKVSVFGDIARNVREGANPKKEPPNMPYVGLEHIEKKQIYISSWSYANQVESHKSQFASGDMLFGKLRPYFHKVCLAPFRGISSTDILVIRSITEEWKGYVQFLLFDEKFVEHANVRSTGTRMPRASWKDMSLYQIAKPSSKIVSNYTKIISGLNKSAKLNVNESRILTQLRDTLLPKLLSGEITVAETQAKIEAAV